MNILYTIFFNIKKILFCKKILKFGKKIEIDEERKNWIKNLKEGDCIDAVKAE